VASRHAVQFSGSVPAATYGLTCIALDATGLDPQATATCWVFMPATGAGLDAHTPAWVRRRVSWFKKNGPARYGAERPVRTGLRPLQWYAAVL